MATSIKGMAKRSRTLHSTVKFARLLPGAPTSVPQDPRRAADIFRVLPNTMLPLPALNNVYECCRAIERDGIEGDVAECGVWAGGAIGLMTLVNRRYGLRPRTFHLFDSFEGLPQPSAEDIDVLESFRDEHPELETDDGEHPDELVAIGACAASAYNDGPLDDVTDLFDRVLRVDPARYVIHQGWFQNTIPEVQPDLGPLAILRLDGDWYESTKTCLDGLYDNLVPGGFLILDDYGFFAGCTQAIDEFLEQRSIPRSLLHVEAWGASLRRPR
jgi:O-methyltransferase